MNIRKDADAAAMGLHNRLANIKPDAHSLFFGSDERLKQLFANIRRNAWAGIANNHRCEFSRIAI